MKRALLFLLSLGFLAEASAQTLYSTTTGQMTFLSVTPVEDISAKNQHVVSVIHTGNKDIQVRVPINKFEFSNKLMQQHFNEDYLESGRYPYAVFKGKFSENIDFSKPGVYDISSAGTLNLHGVEQKRMLIGKLTVTPGTVRLDARFDIKLEDHKIEIPEIVFNKIASSVSVNASIVYLPVKK